MNDELKAKEMSECELEQAAGGNDGIGRNYIQVGRGYTTYVPTGYLALRTQPAYDSSNEIGPLWNGSIVSVNSYNGGTYAYVAVNNAVKGPWGNDVTGKFGYVNVQYLQ